jgi:hypothetical protein
MLIGKINDKNRQKILVTVTKVKGIPMLDLRVHHISEDGEFIATPAGVSLTLEQAKQAVELLIEGSEKLIASQA